MNIRPITILLFLAVFLNSCEKENNAENEKIIADNENLFSIMQNWYLWNDQLDSNTAPSAFKSPQELLDQVRYTQLDRWSNISNAYEFTTYYDEGTYLGYGFSYSWDEENDLRFRFTYDDGPFGEAGIQRGWKLLEIDGTDVQTITDWSNVFGEDQIGFTQSFLIEDFDGNQTEYEIAKDIVTINPVLYADTLTIGTETIGYLVFNNFINPARAQLDEAFALFQSSNINKLILDVRYNGGGQISVASYLANYLIQDDDNGKPLYKFIHNSDRASNNQSHSLFKQGILDLEELIVLSTESTASASELILNGLRPLMKVTHIGEGNTYGKPVGTYSWLSIDETEVYSLISFKFLNSVDEGEFFDGLEPDFNACDDLSKPFGDESEGLFSAAIEYIQAGTTAGCDLITKSILKPALPQEGQGPRLIVNQ